MSFMKNTATTHDVIIVGAGLVGASLACAIARTESNRRLRIAVIEAGQEPPAYKGAHVDPRVVALTPASRKWLEQVGAWDSDRKSTRLNSSHVRISYAVFCLKK